MSASIDQFLLDSKANDLLVVPLFEGEFPFQRTTGLLDWRLSSLLSKLVKKGHLTGSDDEKALIPADCSHGARYILCIGLGKRNAFSKTNIKEISKSLAEQTEKLQIDHIYIIDNFSESEVEDTSDLRKAMQTGFKNAKELLWIN